MLNELPAGHELDREIARLLGWDTKSFPLHPNNPDDGFINTVWVDPHGEVKGKSVHAYSTDSNASLSLEPEDFKFWTSYLYDDPVVVYLVPRHIDVEASLATLGGINLSQYPHGAADTVPLARCRAFLAWKALND
jgi:hypothetical protein